MKQMMCKLCILVGICLLVAGVSACKRATTMVTIDRRVTTLDTNGNVKSEFDTTYVLSEAEHKKMLDNEKDKSIDLSDKKRYPDGETHYDDGSIKTKIETNGTTRKLTEYYPNGNVKQTVVYEKK
jgi:antitoxin component YwqK of YwqJK toxin-antitoxin module